MTKNDEKNKSFHISNNLDREKRSITTTRKNYAINF